MKITGKHELEMPVSIEFEIASAPKPEGIEGLEQIEPKALLLQIRANTRKIKKAARTIKKDTKLLLRTLDKMKRHGWLVLEQEDSGTERKTLRQWQFEDRGGKTTERPVCSGCGSSPAYFLLKGLVAPPYCHECGAKMKKEVREEERRQ